MSGQKKERNKKAKLLEIQRKEGLSGKYWSTLCGAPCKWAKSLFNK